MANIAAADVTYTVVNQRIGLDSRSCNTVRLAFGDSALTYPAGGIPLTIGKLGCPTNVESLVVVDRGTSGYGFMYDQSEAKLVMVQAPVQSHSHSLFLKNADQTDDTTHRVNAASNKIGANTGSNITVAASDGTAAGGILTATLAAAALSEPSAVAIAAQTIEVEVIGY